MYTQHDEYTALGLEALDGVDGGDPEKARIHFKSALSAAITNGIRELYSFYENLCVAELAADRITEAEASARKCIQLAPMNSLGHYLLGHSYMRTKRYTRALHFFESHLELCDERERKVARVNLDTVRELCARHRAQSNRDGPLPSPPGSANYDEDFRMFMTVISKPIQAILGIIQMFVHDFMSYDVIVQSVMTIVFFIILFGLTDRGQCDGYNRVDIYACSEVLDRLPILNKSQSNDLCTTLVGGHWVVSLIILTNFAAFPLALHNLSRWHVGKHNLTHERLLLYQFAHVDISHLMGNMGTVYAVGEEISTALGCNQLMLAVLYLCSGWGGGIMATWLGVRPTVGASGSISGLLVALCVLRPNDAVRVIGDIAASNPVQFMLGTLVKDLLHPNISWQGHLGGGLVGFFMCSCRKYMKTHL